MGSPPRPAPERGGPPARRAAPAPAGPDEALTGQIINALDSLPEKQRVALTAVLVSEYHNGPLPAPQTLAGYAAVLSESPREILDMARTEQAHQNDYRDRALDSEINYRLLTLFAAFIIVFTMVVGAIVLAIAGHDEAAIALSAASGLTLIAGAFLRGRDLFPTNKPSPPAAPGSQPAKPRPNRPPQRGKR